MLFFNCSLENNRWDSSLCQLADSPRQHFSFVPIFPPYFQQNIPYLWKWRKDCLFSSLKFLFWAIFLCDPTIFDPFSMTHYCLLIFLCVLLFVLCPSFFFILFSFLFFVCLFFLNFLSVVLFSSNFHQFSFQTVLLFWITNWYCLLFWQLNTFLVPFLYLTPPQTSTDLGLDSALASVIYLLSHVSSLFGIIFILLFERALIQKRMLYFNFFFYFFCKLKDILSWIGGRSLRNCYDSALRRWQSHSRSPPITLCEWFARQR